MAYTNKPCPICGGSDRFYLIAAPQSGGDPYWRCRQCDYTEPHIGDDGSDDAALDHDSRRAQLTPEQTIEAHYAYTVIADRCAKALWTKAGESALGYLRKRGFSDAMIRGAKLGWSGDGADLFCDLFYTDVRAYDAAFLYGGLRRRQGVPRPVLKYTITIPYELNGTVTLLRARKLAPKPNEARYLSPAGALYAGAAPTFYLHHVLQEAPAAILTEGELKALAAHQEWRAGRSPLPCVATSGIMYLPPALLDALKGKTVYLAYDNELPKRGNRESAGERAISRNGAKLRDAGIAVKVIELPRPSDTAKVDLDSYIVDQRRTERAT
jgi:DNA primase